jgi:dihydroxy-acid dehydratase
MRSSGRSSASPTRAAASNNCHRHFPELIDAVKRGVLAAGGLPIEFPTTSLGEVFLNPTSMMFRNLMSIDVEEMVRAQPMDSVVLVGGCDKTVPAQLMGAASADVPAVQLLAGPMMPTSFRGERLGACTDCRRFWAMHRAGKVDEQGIEEIEGNLATTAGTCAVMGTASTMAAIAEALGMALAGSAAIPAVHSDRLRAAEASGARAVELAKNPIRPSQVITPASVENALRVLLAIGGSTNAIVHLTAIAGRLGIPVSLERLNVLSDSTPVLVDLKPTGQYYMSDLHAAGGVGAVLRELKPLLNLECLTVAGITLGERIEREPSWVDRSVVKPLAEPLAKEGGLVALFGSLAPNGAILKRSAADPGAIRARRARGRLLFARRSCGAHRRPGARRDRGRFPRAAERRAEVGLRDARGRIPADSVEARALGRQGHGADLGRAHERHRVRHDRAARLARGRSGRPACAGAQRRSDPALGEVAQHRPRGR